MPETTPPTVTHVIHVTARPIAEDAVWCDDCEEWVTSGDPAATHTDDRCLVPVNDYGDECGQRPVFSTVEDQVAQGRVPACAGHTGQIARGRVPDFRDPQPLAAQAPAPASGDGTCPKCRHASHSTLGFCPNMASDNDCACTFRGDA